VQTDLIRRIASHDSSFKFAALYRQESPRTTSEFHSLISKIVTHRPATSLDGALFYGRAALMSKPFAPRDKFEVDSVVITWAAAVKSNT
jgi:hypothetical protein